MPVSLLLLLPFLVVILIGVKIIYGLSEGYALVLRIILTIVGAIILIAVLIPVYGIFEETLLNAWYR